MKSLLVLSFIWIHPAFAAPSLRPLPAGISDETVNYTVFRDHQEREHFYAFPKVLRMRDRRLTPYGEQGEGCMAVTQYLSAQRLLVESKSKLAEISLKRAELVYSLLEDLQRLNREQTKLYVEKVRLEELIAAQTEAGIAAEELAKLQKQLDDLNGRLAQLDKTITQIEKIQKMAEDEQGKILEQVTKLEDSLEKFEAQVTRPSARIQMRITVPNADPELEVKQELGITQGSLVFPRIIGLTLYPSDEDDLGLILTPGGGKTIGLYRPEWSVRSFEPTEALLGQSTLSSSMELVDFPTDIYFEQMLSLYSYCAIKDQWEEPGFSYPIRMSYQVAVWKDKERPAVKQSYLFAHQWGVPASDWPLVQDLPIAEKPATQIQDLGAPEFFSGEGTYEAYSVNLRLESK